MSIFSKLFSRQKTIVGLEELGKIFGSQSGAWSASNQLEQYGKSLYVFAAVNKIATKVAAIDMRLYRIINRAGDSEEVLNHDILNLLSKINPFQTRSEFLKTAWINKKLTGEAFWVKVRNNRGKVVELWNLRPDLMTVVSDPESYIKYYEFQKSDGKKEIFKPEDIIFFKDPNPTNTFRGISPIAVSKFRIETEDNATRFQRDFFLNSGRPDALLLTEHSMADDQRSQMISSWEERHQGPRSSSRIGLLEGGMKYQQVALSQREMDYIESMKFTRDDILVAFGVPKAVITTDDVNYANAEAGLRMFLSETIDPEMKHLVEVLNEFLVIPDFGEEFYLDHIDPTPSDRAAQRADHAAGFGKWLTANEIRSEYNLPEIEGGDVIASNTPAVDSLTQLSLKTARRNKTLKILQGRPGLFAKFELKEALAPEIKAMILNEMKPKKQTKSTTRTKSAKTTKVKFASMMPTPETRQKYYEVVNKKLDTRAKDFEVALRKEFALQEERVLAALAETDKSNKGIVTKMRHDEIMNLFDKTRENRVFSVVALPYITDIAEAGGVDAADLTDEIFNMTDAIRAKLEKRASFFAQSVNDTTFQKLIETLSEGVNAGEGIGELTARVQSVYNEIPEWRARMIARTETTNANNEGHLEQYRQSEIVKGKEWVATLDDRTRDEHLSINGQIVDIDANFSNGLPYPQEINCRCVLAPARFE